MGRRMTTEEYIAKARAVHGDRYDYSKVAYKNGLTKVTIICPEHGEFQQQAQSHIHLKQGCPVCATFQRKATCLQRYGTELMCCTPEAYERRKQATLEKYGVENPFSLPEVQDKIKKTLQEKYGVENPMQSPELLKKAQETNTQRYGSYCSFQNAEVQAKQKETLMQRYGVRNSMQVPETRAKAIRTCMERYGVPNGMQSPEIIERSLNARLQNQTFNTSTPEETLYGLLVITFGKDDVKRQYKSKEYPFRCDFYIESRNLYIELNATWLHGTHWFDQNNEQDQDELKRRQEKAKEGPMYASSIKTWTQSDVKKRETARQNRLNYVVFWDNGLKDADMWFAAGCPDGHDYDGPFSWLEKEDS